MCPFPRDTFTLAATVNSPETLGLKISSLPRGPPALLASQPSHANSDPTHSGLLRVGSFSGLPVHVSVARRTRPEPDSICPYAFSEGCFLVPFSRTPGDTR